jgi:uncharacterized protein YegL
MGKYDFEGVEQPTNFEQKCPCILVLDVSGSMSGNPITQLNEGLQKFQSDIMNDPIAKKRLEVGIVTFESSVNVVQEPKLIDQFQMPYLETGGSTMLVDGVREAIKLVEKRKSWLRETGQNFYRPYVVLITDGQPDGGQDVNGLGTEIRQGVNGKHFNFWAFGVEGANMEMLKSISDPSTPPLYITNCDFAGFFKWLSNSMDKISKSKSGDKIDLTPENPGLFQHTV